MPPVTRVSFHYRADESPWQVGIDGRETGESTVGTLEDSMPIRLVHVRPLLGAVPQLVGVQFVTGVVFP